MARVSLVSLGCPKNLVDSEGALGEIAEAGHDIVTDASRADVIVVNTCGFVESARDESVAAVVDALEEKKIGHCRAVIVIGCLSQRFGDELKDELAGIDVLLGVAHQGKIAGAIEKALRNAECGVRNAESPPLLAGEGRGEVSARWAEPSSRVQSTPPWTAYLKISDGCSNRCAYCAIPDIRGPYRSRPEYLILDEARRLADSGVKEIVLVGQDLTQYGEEWKAEIGKPKATLAGLVEKLNGIDGLWWIRLMYCYPTRVTAELIDAIASCEKVVKYVDLPLQHGDDGVLKAMNRRGSVDDYLRVIDDLRSKCPEIALRSTFIVGFPGETEAAFENLLRFVERIRFDRVGVFTYSREEGTPAALLMGRDSKSRPIKRQVAEKRMDRLMRLQQRISLERNRSLVGTKMEVLVEGVERLEGSKVGSLFGRSYRDAPEIDGLVFLPGSAAQPGTFVTATITEATEYDLVGRLAREE